MRRLNNKGMGFIGISLILILMMFFFSAFYVTLEMIHVNVLEVWIDSASTQDFYDSLIRPMWLSFGFFFLLSIIIWGVVQTQSAYNIAAIAGIWVVILFGYTVLTAIFISFDKIIMEDLMGFLPMDLAYVGVYENLIKPLWRAAPVGIYVLFIFFGLYMASTYAEKAGSTYVSGFSGGRF